MVFRNSLLAILSFFIFLTACVEDKTAGPIGIDSGSPNLTHNGIWIINEGGFTLGQASISYLDFVEDSIYNNVFESINSRPLGDVLQSMTFHKGKAYLVVNNSRKIEVVDSVTFISLATISNLNAPRNLLAYNNQLYITDLYSNEIVILDANDYSTIKTIETGGWTDEMLVFDEKLYVTVQQTFMNNLPNSRKGIMIIDIQTNEEVAFIPLAQGANSIQIDRNNKLWVLCDGGLEEEIGGIYKIDLSDNSIELNIPFSTIEFAGSSLQINNQKDHLYFIVSDPNDGLNAYDIMEISIEDVTLPENPWFDGELLYIFGFIIDEDRNEFYFNDAVGLIQEGFCYRYSLFDKTFINKYKTGVFPSKIYQYN